MMLSLGDSTWALIGIALAAGLIIVLKFRRQRGSSADTTSAEAFNSNAGSRGKAQSRPSTPDNRPVGDSDLIELKPSGASDRLPLPGAKSLRQIPSDAARLIAHGIPILKDTDDVLRHFGLELGAMLALANPASRVRPGKGNYVEWTVAKKRGRRRRVICSPKPKLKAVQQRIRSEILDRIPTHPACHGFVRNRSIVTNAQSHLGRKLVVNLDLRDFFEHVSLGNVIGVFRHAGYGTEVSRWLGRLCTHAPQYAMKEKFSHLPLHRCRISRHTVQGAPTSPALANLACLRLDRRLTGLATRFQATYTRYADDLTFSGDEFFKRGMIRFLDLVNRIIREEGFRIHPGKRRFMRPGERQQVTGVVVNRRVNVARDEYDRLKAIIHNARKTGLDAQNRDNRPDFRAYLLGRAAHVAQLNPERGRRLIEAIRAV